MVTPLSTSSRNVPLLDLAALHEPIREQIDAAIATVTSSGQFILGEAVRQLEAALASYTRCERAVGCASGSDALLLALLAAGVRAGDQVVTTSFSFFATAGAISRAGAIPIFVDIDPETFNLNPAQVEDVLSRHPRVRAVMPVHLYGGAADMDAILDAAGLRGISVIEDAAQAIGAEYRGRPVMSLGAMGCTSFFPSKNLGGFGDGGMVTTNDAALADQLAALRVHGSRRRYFHDWVGLNSRLDTLQAAILQVKLPHLDDWTRRRQRVAAQYDEALNGLPVTRPRPAPYQTSHVWNQYVIRAPRRDELRAWLDQAGVATEVYYPLPLHLQQCYLHLGYVPGELPESERASREVLALPMHSTLDSDDVGYVASAIRRFYAG